MMSIGAALTTVLPGRGEMTFAKYVEGMRLYYRSAITEKDTVVTVISSPPTARAA
jgi:hypothetical protein